MLLYCMRLLHSIHRCVVRAVIEVPYCSVRNHFRVILICLHSVQYLLVSVPRSAVHFATVLFTVLLLLQAQAGMPWRWLCMRERSQ